MADKDKQGKSEADISETFLRAYLAQGGKAVDAESGEDISDENVDAFLQEVGGGEAARPESRKEKAAKTEAATTTDEEKAAKAKAEADAKAQKEAEAAAAQKQQQQQAALTQLAGQAATAVGDRAGALADRVGSLSTVGGIGLLVMILILLLFVVVQVNTQGDTRLKLLWAMVNGQTQLQGRVTPTGGPTPGGSEGEWLPQTQNGQSGQTTPAPAHSGSFRGLTPF